jgi:hypothetical protein
MTWAGAECEVTAVRLHCAACGTSGVVTRDVGDVRSRVLRFAAHHLGPHVVAVRASINGVDLGWSQEDPSDAHVDA